MILKISLIMMLFFICQCCHVQVIVLDHDSSTTQNLKGKSFQQLTHQSESFKGQKKYQNRGKT